MAAANAYVKAAATQSARESACSLAAQVAIPAMVFLSVSAVAAIAAAAAVSAAERAVCSVYAVMRIAHDANTQVFDRTLHE